jgi:murein DD-endopeptidase MepM/ murein hydrolase activator NlpD
MKNKSILIFSRTGKPVRSVKVNFFRVFFLLLFLLCGVAAYLIPSGIFKLNKTELQQKKELNTQNSQLHQKIQSSWQVLDHLKEQVGVLETQKEKVAALAGETAEKAAVDAADARSQRRYDFTVKEISALLVSICRQDSIVSAFAARGKNPFEYIPVCKPILSGSCISKCFGETNDPFTGHDKPHYGTDFSAAMGTPVIATASGTIARIENDNQWGWRVGIDHGKGISTFYAHLGTVIVGRGRRVKRGDVIGTVGSSGLATGPHVHYEVRRNGVPEDPEQYLFPAALQLQQ